MSMRTDEIGQAQMLFLVEQYKSAHGVDHVDPDDVAAWLMETQRYRPEPVDPRQLLRRRIARALKAERYTDPQGRDVRVNHPVVDTRSDGKKHATYHNIRSATPEAMRTSLTQRRDGIVADCRQHRIDFDSYNDNNVFDAVLPAYDYNINHDLEELNQPPNYPDERPHTDDDEDI